MAIVKTTPRETGSGNGDGDNPIAEKSLDRTKSVVNQGGRPLARPSRSSVPLPRTTESSVTQGGWRRVLDDTVAELRKVVWPTREHRNAATLVTIGLLAFFACYILSLEVVIRWLFTAIGILPVDAPR